jgi:hypothetical protein
MRGELDAARVVAADPDGVAVQVGGDDRSSRRTTSGSNPTRDRSPIAPPNPVS